MNSTILISAGLASIAGLLVGLNRHWTVACLVVCLGIPSGLSVAFAIQLDAPTLFDKVGWALITFFYAMICAFIAWGLFAGVNYGVRKLYCKLTLPRMPTP
jgi:hypothetical protein